MEKWFSVELTGLYCFLTSLGVLFGWVANYTWMKVDQLVTWHLMAMYQSNQPSSSW